MTGHCSESPNGCHVIDIIEGSNTCRYCKMEMTEADCVWHRLTTEEPWKCTTHGGEFSAEAQLPPMDCVNSGKPIRHNLYSLAFKNIDMDNAESKRNKKYPMSDDELLSGMTMDEAQALIAKQDPNVKYKCKKCDEILKVFDLPMHLVNIHGIELASLTDIKYVTKLYGEYFIPVR